MHVFITSPALAEIISHQILREDPRRGSPAVPAAPSAGLLVARTAPSSTCPATE